MHLRVCGCTPGPVSTHPVLQYMGYAVHGLLSEVEHSVLQTHLSRCSSTSNSQCPLLFLTSPGIPGEQELRQYGRVDSLGQWASESHRGCRKLQYHLGSCVCTRILMSYLLVKTGKRCDITVALELQSRREEAVRRTEAAASVCPACSQPSSPHRRPGAYADQGN